MIGYRNAIRPLIVIALLLTAFGCTQPPEVKPRAAAPTPAQQRAMSLAADLEAAGDFNAAAQAYERLAAEIPGLRDELLLRAAESRVRDGQPQPALDLLARVDRRRLSQLQGQTADLTRARALVDLQRASEALALLGPRPPARTGTDLMGRRLAVQADALLQLDDRLGSARARSELDLLLTDPAERLANQEQLLRTLVPLFDLLLSRPEPGDPLFSGWKELALAAKALEQRPQQPEAALTAWRERHPTHPAMTQLLAGYLGLAERDLSELGRIAVLLPSSGRYAQAAGAIRDGLLDAYYRADPAQRPELVFYDTTNETALWPLLQQAVEEGAGAAIGPLQKSAVEQLARAGDLSIPVLALNRVELDVPPPAGLYQFGLAPEDEAAQAAEKAWADGALTALALVPDGDWGERLAGSFRQRFEALGGRLLERQNYDSNQNDFTQPLLALLDLDESRARYDALVRTLGQTMEFEPQRRNDAGALFLAATADKARQLWPQLQFHHIGGLPVYTTSAIHARRFSAPRDLDLAGLTFPDTPWLLNRSQADGDPTPDGALGRLYAMGMDSYRLLASLQRLETFPGSRLEGATGRLGLDSLRRVQRRLPWARMGNRGLEVLGYLPEPAGADPTATPLPAAPTGNASGN